MTISTTLREILPYIAELETKLTPTRILDELEREPEFPMPPHLYGLFKEISVWEFLPDRLHSAYADIIKANNITYPWIVGLRMEIEYTIEWLEAPPVNLAVNYNMPDFYVLNDPLSPLMRKILTRCNTGGIVGIIDKPTCFIIVENQFEVGYKYLIMDCQCPSGHILYWMLDKLHKLRNVYNKIAVVSSSQLVSIYEILGFQTVVELTPDKIAMEL